MSQVGYNPVAPKFALPIPTTPGMSADERLRLLLKKRKSEEPQRRTHGYETSDEVWPRDDGEEPDDLKEELRRKRKKLEMKPFVRENRGRHASERSGIGRGELPEDPRKNRPKHSEAAPPSKRPPVAPPIFPGTTGKGQGPMPPPPKKKAMPTSAPKTPPKKRAEKPKTPVKELSGAPKAAGHVPKAPGIEPPKTPPKMARKTPSAAARSISPTLVDAAAAPTAPKPSGVARTKDSSPTRPLEGLPEQAPMPTTPSEAFRAADDPGKASSLAATSPAQSVAGPKTPEAGPKPPPPPLESPPAVHQEPPPPPTEIGFPVTEASELPKSPIVAPVLPEVFTGEAVH